MYTKPNKLKVEHRKPCAHCIHGVSYTAGYSEHTASSPYIFLLGDLGECHQDNFRNEYSANIM